MRQGHKTLLVWALLIFAFVLVWWFLSSGKKQSEIPFFDLVQKVERSPQELRAKRLQIRIGADSYAEIGGELKSGERFKTKGYVGEQLLEKLNRAAVPYEISHESGTDFWQVLTTWLPMLVLVVLFLVFMRQLRVGGGQTMSFGKSKAKLRSESQRQFRFADVGGVDGGKEKVEQIVDFLRDPMRYTGLGARIPKGVLLVGPPGTGKTLLAKAIAGEAGVPFFSISGSDFVEMFVGVGASRVRDLFETCKKNAPCIVFIDEIDAVGRHRGAGIGGGHDEREQTLNQLLVELDGFESSDGVIVIGATNRPDILDPALTRPGRFDRKIEVHLPSLRDRRRILEIHVKKKPLAPLVDLDDLAGMTGGMTGADLEDLTNEAALAAGQAGADQIGPAHLHAAAQYVGAPIPGRQDADRGRLIEVLEKSLVSQADAKEMLATAAAVHYENCRTLVETRGAGSASATLLIGPPGVGKTRLARALARHLGVPFALIDAVSALEAHGADGIAERILRRLVKAADGKIARAEHGIICIQNLQQLEANPGANALLFQTLRRLIDGDRVELRLSENLVSTSSLAIQTRGILFILEGTFRRIQERARDRAGQRGRTGDGRRVVVPQDLLEIGVPHALADHLAAHAAILEDLSADMLANLARERWHEVARAYPLGTPTLRTVLEPMETGLQTLAAIALERGTSGHAVEALLQELFRFAARTSTLGERVLVDKEYVEAAIYRSQRASTGSSAPKPITNEGDVVDALGRRRERAAGSNDRVKDPAGSVEPGDPWQKVVAAD